MLKKEIVDEIIIKTTDQEFRKFYICLV